MKCIAITASILISSLSFADCEAPRYSRPDPADGKPVFTLLSCRPDLEYVLENEDKFENQFGYREYTVTQITPSDMAIEVRPHNKSAAAFMKEREKELWHYSGSSDDLPLGKLVTLITQEHCSDTGLTMHLILNDVTIKDFALYQ